MSGAIRIGIEIPTEYRKDAEGVVMGYHFDCPITDLRDGFDMVKPSTFGLDRDGTREEQAFLEDTFGDILPVALRSGTYGHNCLTNSLMRLMSMETFFMAMYDCPDKLHALHGDAARQRHAHGALGRGGGAARAEQRQPVHLRHLLQFHHLASQSDAVARGQVKLSDMWGVMDSQETVGVSPALFHEFCFPYYRDLAEMFGLVYWGCCEPADPIWETSLSKLPNLKAVSISRWADQRYMAEALAGTGIVFSRKPDPNLLGVDVVLDEEAWAAEIRETLELTAGKNIPLEFVVRDVYTMHGNLGKPRRAIEIARREIDKFYPA